MNKIIRTFFFIGHLFLGLVCLVALSAICIPAIGFFALGYCLTFWVKNGPFADAKKDIIVFWDYIPTVIVGTIENLIRVCTVK